MSNSSGATIDSLLAPISMEQFLNCYWEKASFHIPRNDRDFYRNVLRSEDVETFLKRDDIRYPALRLAKDGPTVPPSAYSSILKFGSYASEGLINVMDVHRFHDEGSTVILQMTRSSIPRLSEFANRLQMDLQCNVETTVYATPPNSQGFTTHYDTHSVLILQIAGKKRWRLYDVLFELPTLDQTFDQSKTPPGGVRSEVLLEPGDLLYVPRGLAHDALAEGEMSLHVTVGLFPPTWIDLFGELISEFKNDLRFRKSPINQILTGHTDAVSGEAMTLLQEIRKRFNSTRLITEYARKAAAKMTQCNESRLNDTLGIDHITLRTVVGRRKEINCNREESVDRINISYYGKKISFPKAVARAIDRIFEHDEIAVGELQSNLSEASKISIVRKLIKEGLLRIRAIG